jgi:signal transduction histidine kinase
LAEDTQLYADKNMLSIILRNLISNSIKFTPINGDIVIKAEQKSNQIEFSVSDNGVGLDDDKQTKLFIMGATESTNGTEHEKGCGIGLILCKEFVEKHGGQIWVESKKGEGCNFKFTLPLIGLKKHSETES